MYIHVHVTPESKKEYVKRVSVDSFIISLKEPPANNQANEKVFMLLQEYFPKQRIILKQGGHRYKKLFEIV